LRAAAIMLSASGVVKSFGGLRAVNGVSLELKPGGLTGLIGPNGAGKTTFFNCLAGSLKPDAGQISFEGRRIDGQRPDAIFRRGLARTFQIPKPFPAMSVLDNIMLSPLSQDGEAFWANWLKPGQVARREAQVREAARGWIDFVGLTPLIDQPARVLSGGQRKLLELARVMAAEPRLVLLDEPGAGVNPALLETIVAKIAELNRRGVGFLIIEHNMEVISTLCETVIVMAEGGVLATGKPADVIRDARVIDAYLGAAA
jgi:branched-chain amino acid transport system ATP-binding protein